MYVYNLGDDHCTSTVTSVKGLVSYTVHMVNDDIGTPPNVSIQKLNNIIGNIISDSHWCNKRFGYLWSQTMFVS